MAKKAKSYLCPECGEFAPFVFPKGPLQGFCELCGSEVYFMDDTPIIIMETVNQGGPEKRV